MRKYKEYETDKEAQEVVDRFFKHLSDTYTDSFLEALEDCSNLTRTIDYDKNCEFAGAPSWRLIEGYELTEEQYKRREKINKEERYIKEENRYLETGVIVNYFPDIACDDPEEYHFCTVITNEEFYERLCKACEIYIDKYPELEIQIKELLEKINESLKRNFFKWGEWRINNV